MLERLPDGSFLTRPRRDIGHRHRDEKPVRIVEYTLDLPGCTPNRLRAAGRAPSSTPGSPRRRPGRKNLHRLELETALDELKTHQRGPHVVLRSKQLDRVIQELYGYLCVHWAIRWLMHTVAADADTDPDRISFTRTLRVARRTTASPPGFPHSDPR